MTRWRRRLTAARRSGVTSFSGRNGQWQQPIPAPRPLLDDEWAAFFRQHGFLVGPSIDGPAGIHDTYRVDKGGKGSFGRVMNGLAALRRHGVEWNALTTVHAANQDRGREVYAFPRDACGARFMQFIPIVERVTPDSLPAANAGWGRWVRQLRGTSSAAG